MSDVNVLEEILTWSANRPHWQRDALRRIVAAGSLTDDDNRQLADICKAKYGLEEAIQAAPLSEDHLPDTSNSQDAVLLSSLTHHAVVNALASEQTLEFSPSLTIVYGDNAAGKSGYTRILKQACRARGSEEILGNVTSGSATGVPSATLKCSVGADEQSTRWDGEDTPTPALGRISVFDRHCASVYVSDKTDVAFRPLGLDVFDKLSDACQAVKQLIEKDRKGLKAPSLPLVPDVAEGTEVAKLLDGLSSLTEPEKVAQLATLSAEEQEELSDLNKRMADAAAASPRKAAKELETRATRVGVFLDQAESVCRLLEDQSLQQAFGKRDKQTNAVTLAEALRKQSFGTDCLEGSGSPLWQSMWQAAKAYSEQEAYPEHDFPVIDDADCVFCQQPIGTEAGERLIGFKEFLSSTAQEEASAAKKAFLESMRELTSLSVETPDLSLALEELSSEDEDLAKAVSVYLKQAVSRQEAAIEALQDGRTLSDVKAPLDFDYGAFARRVERMKDRAGKLREGENAEATKKLAFRLSQLQARKQLAEHLEVVLGEITRQKQIAAYQLCIDETNTKAITRKSTDVTKKAVTEQLSDAFATELKFLNFKHIEVELQAAGGERGALYHRLALKRAPGVSVPRVVSEGEARCLSIASFFAELSTADEASAILFDDPVSSLDHYWRESVAKRLVYEGQTRQVVVFTHDIVFLLALIGSAEQSGVDYTHQHIRRDSNGAGVAVSELPWAAMPVNKRIGYLKNKHQEAGKSHRDGHLDLYEALGARIYGQTRETWERAIEEVLLNGVVERYRNSVQTQRAKKLADIEDEDYRVLEAGMSKCSRWMTGHDSAAAENAPFPDPDELLGDIEELEEWVKAIRVRRR